MKRFCLIISLFTIIIGSTNYCVIANNKDNIVDNIEKGSDQNIRIILPKGLKNRLNKENGSTTNSAKKVTNTGVGYRIQIFSDNNSSTAKREAQSKENAIISHFPMLRSYITYKAPAWRLRVGDFRTKEEARDMMHQLKQAFPSYSKEMTIVMDRINIKSDDEI